MRRLLCRLTALAAAVLFSVSCARTAVRTDASAGTGHATVLQTALRWYRGPLDHLSAVRAGTCPMYPSCSAYGLQAVDAHGAVKGWLMIVDRLIRCGRDETGYAPMVFVDGRWKYYDPLEKNDLFRGIPVSP